MKLASVVMFVSDLGRSVDFYCELLELDCSIRDNSAALLVGSEGNQLYLRAVGGRATHPLGGIGPQYALWTAASDADLDRCETLLRTASPHVRTTREAGFRMIEGRDPDDAPVVVCYPGPDTVPRRAIISRIYDW